MQFKQSICVIFLSGEATNTTVASTIRLLEPLARETHIVIASSPVSTKLPVLISVFRFILIQIKTVCKLLAVANKVDIVFLAAGSQALVLPAVSAKLLRKKLILLHLGLSRTAQGGYWIPYSKTLSGLGKYIFPWLVGLLEGWNYRLSDRIITFLPSTREYGGKVQLGSRFYVDTDTFSIKQKLSKRQNTVGYIGRLEEVKGAINFIMAIPLVINSDAHFAITGDGSLRDEIVRWVDGDKVAFVRWIPHSEIPRYLNKLKLLVIPSYREVGPQILFEAMACGTPVLAMPVGVIPSVIDEGKTGFIMNDNTPECIAQNITRVLNHPNLDEIARNARELIEREYTYEVAVGKYRSILESL